MGVVVLGVIAGLLAMGCEEEEEIDPSQIEPYNFANFEINSEGESPEWAPGDDHVTRWFESAMDESDRGVSRKEEGMEMRVSLHHQIRVEQLRRGARLVIDIEAQAERNVVNAEAPMVTLTANAQYRHLLTQEQPSEAVLHALSRTMGQQAVEDVVTQFRLRARVRQLNASKLLAWIEDPELPDPVRRYAIRRAVIHLPDGLEETLLQVADESNDAIAASAARGLYNMESEEAAHALMRVAQRLSRDGEYDTYIELLPILAELDAPWVSIYLETVAYAHSVKRVRSRARAVLADEQH